MSTNDVPGAKDYNNDALAMGAWAEHADGSLMLVESTEANRVIYSVFDMARDPPIEYRDAMPEASFKTTYSWEAGSTKKKLNEKWTWHDKTPFPWDRIIKHFKDGPKSAAADHTTTAAERIMASRDRHATAAQRVADELHLKGEELDRSNFEDRMERVLDAAKGFVDHLFGAAKRAADRGRANRED